MHQLLSLSLTHRDRVHAVPSADVPGLEPGDLEVLGGLHLPGEEVPSPVPLLMKDS